MDVDQDNSRISTQAANVQGDLAGTTQQMLEANSSKTCSSRERLRNWKAVKATS